MNYVLLNNYDSTRKWMRQIRKKSVENENGNASKATLKSCNFALQKFVEYTKKTPDQLIHDAKESVKKCGSTEELNDQLDDFWDKYPSKTSARQIFALIKSFYSANGIKVTSKTPSMPKMRGNVHIPSSNEIRMLCDVANIAHRSWILVNNYLGLRIGGITHLTLADFKPENWVKDLPLYPVRIRREVSGTFEYNTWIGYDAVQLLKTYVKDYNIGLNDYMWNYGETYLNQKFKRYAKKAGLIKSSKGLSPLFTHCLRKRRQTLQESCKTNLNWVDHLIGHIPRGANGRSYSFPEDASPDDLYGEVLKCLPKLEIYGHHPESPTEGTVELQRLIAIEQLKRLPNMDEGKLREIESILFPPVNV